ncbi:MAG: Stk1 family PASTA domain-containing Ser/Thr kinase [Actinomycetota bacterium]|nr:Stk1 family PASTA domain-containing Ser/Thr kinase [Actinomycetota bacterium]
MATTRDTLIDAVFDGRYRIIRKLGAGGMANVYLAEDQELGRRVAIKILNDRHAGDDQFIERFRREAKNAAGLSHPNIVSIYDRGEAEGTYYIAMEFLDGRSLKELILTRGPAPVARSIEYARQILAALAHAHQGGIVHRDIKPHNVVVNGDGRLKVTDFGIARSGASQMTEVGSIIGTAQYLSPEQARGSPVDQRSDLYSVGIVLYEMLTGKVPFTGDTPLEIAMKHLSAIPKPPSQVRRDVPHDLDLIVLRALAKDPDERYQSAEEMDDDLTRVARGLSVAAETADAATQVLAGSGITTAATAISPRPRAAAAPRPPAQTPPAGYYGYSAPPKRKRPIWPWLLTLGLLVLAGVAAYFAYDKIQQQLNANKPVAVENCVGINVQLCVKKLRHDGLKPKTTGREHPVVPANQVIEQNPTGGARIPKGDPVTIVYSTGKPKTTVPNVVGVTRDEAISRLTRANLTPYVVEIYTSKPVGTVTAQDPKPGTRLLYGQRVRINVSRGVEQVDIPDVKGQSYESARGALQGVGFHVARQDVSSDQPVGTVVDQNPAAGTKATRGSTITLSVSSGPAPVEVPNVKGQLLELAQAALESAGFTVNVVERQVTDLNQDNVVLSQDPTGKADPGSTVTITVGVYSGP